MTHFNRVVECIITTCIGDPSMTAQDRARVVELWIQVAKEELANTEKHHRNMPPGEQEASQGGGVICEGHPADGPPGSPGETAAGCRPLPGHVPLSPEAAGHWDGG
ncbi:uncharacterized protein LOC131395267 isoform X2 [Diceros bicornis minor]|uniref:uncharacterized protein LOC131395267 isoform X2 n=1 Tax=Diceros bicornis minor TaxID=77932 RepID=UPI0026EB1FA3|nr:uncharacterized protein LOC131395267 isoform X2 [Diceros bicornis minor]